MNCGSKGVERDRRIAGYENGGELIAANAFKPQ